MNDKITYEITIYGIVQGVGYRPFVLRLAKECRISGYVKNLGGIVSILSTGKKEAMNNFIHRLSFESPRGSIIYKIEKKEVPFVEFQEFTIIESAQLKTIVPIIPSDLGVCPSCVEEFHDKKNRRYHHPFISCVSCGPRYTIMKTLPYDRHTTVMKEFPMCPLCNKEYTTEEDIRCHAQTIGCYECGPQLNYFSNQKEITVFQENQKSLDLAVEDIQNGKLIAVKGIGGFHLVCSPKYPDAILQLREAKGREKKPFAVMFPNMEEIKKSCYTNEEEEKLLLSDAKPIVLLRKKKEFYQEVCNNSPDIGCFLPYNPIQILLLEKCGPLIMTSANISGEPIITKNNEMLNWSKNNQIAGVLYHEREIVIPIDDSLVRVLKGKTQFIRRARGFVPLPVFLKDQMQSQVLALGGDLKSAFSYFAEDRAYLSQYLGDLESIEIQKLYRNQLEHMRELFSFDPKVVAYDLHPKYISSQIAEEIEALLTVPIQHHEAHIASVIAEHRLEGQGKVLGVAFDGTGFGKDGAVWGGEFFVYQKYNFERIGHLEYTKYFGGDEFAKNGEMIKNCILYHCGVESDSEEMKFVKAAIKNNFNVYQSSSMGRFFDCISSLLNICNYNEYEAQAAMELENTAFEAATKNSKPYKINFTIGKEEDKIQIGYQKLVLDLLEGLKAKVPIESLSLGFHYAVAQLILDMALLAREQFEINMVALSGGVFLNTVLLEKTIELLVENGFQFYINEQVPVTDGGICLGQGYLAGNWSVSQMNLES